MTCIFSFQKGASKSTAPVASHSTTKVLKEAVLKTDKALAKSKVVEILLS